MNSFIKIHIRKFLICAIMLLNLCQIHVFCQGLHKTLVAPNLYKVQSGNYYGICDENENILVSVEYSDIIFVGDIGLLTKNNGRVYGYVKTDGKVLYFSEEYDFNPKFPYYSEGYLPVKKVLRSNKEQWLYLDIYGEPIPISGTRSLPLILNHASAFSGGYAVAKNKKGAIVHIDKKGNERFIINADDVRFRSAVRDGECVIICGTGIKVYQENKEDRKAIVKINLSQTCTDPKLNSLGDCQTLTCKEGTLYMDYLGRVDKYVYSNGTSVSLKKEHQKPKRVDPPKDSEDVVKPVSVFDLNNDIKISLSKSTVNATEKGYAYTMVYVDNVGANNSGNIKIVVKSSEMQTKQEECRLTAGSRQSIKISVPARFQEKERKRTVTIIVSDGKYETQKTFTLTIKRYEPEVLL